MKKQFFLIILIIQYAYTVVVSNLKLSFDILFRPHLFEPGFFDYDTSDMKPFQNFTLFNLISMTPGTLSVTYNWEKHLITVHTLYGKQKYTVIKDIEYLQKLIIKSI